MNEMCIFTAFENNCFFAFEKSKIEKQNSDIEFLLFFYILSFFNPISKFMILSHTYKKPHEFLFTLYLGRQYLFYCCRVFCYLKY